MSILLNVSDRVMNTGRVFYYAGLGIAAAVSGETKRVFDSFSEKGRASRASKEQEGPVRESLTGKVKGLSHQVTDRVASGVSGTLNRFGVPNSHEIKSLCKSVEELTQKVEALQKAS